MSMRDFYECLSELSPFTPLLYLGNVFFDKTLSDLGP